MQIVANIDDNLYTRLFDNGDTDAMDMQKACAAIRKGTPLPKGHGRIGDLDRLYDVFERNVVSADAFKELFDHAPTIIEADKEGAK